MTISKHRKEIVDQMTQPGVKRSDIKKLAKEIKKNHDLAMEVWSNPNINTRLLATLIMDKKKIDQSFMDQIVNDLADNEAIEVNHITEWLMANQLMKSKSTVELLNSWQHHESSILRRLFWYYQARLRWTGKVQDNSSELIVCLESDLEKEEPNVQWAMNFTAGWIGVYEEEFRDRCINLGKKVGLYKDEKIPKGCVPSYLPNFIKVELNKQKK